jgi:hypothetical protein
VWERSSSGQADESEVFTVLALPSSTHNYIRTIFSVARFYHTMAEAITLGHRPPLLPLPPPPASTCGHQGQPPTTEARRYPLYLHASLARRRAPKRRVTLRSRRPGSADAPCSTQGTGSWPGVGPTPPYGLLGGRTSFAVPPSGPSSARARPAGPVTPLQPDHRRGASTAAEVGSGRIGGGGGVKEGSWGEDGYQRFRQHQVRQAVDIKGRGEVICDQGGSK